MKTRKNKIVIKDEFGDRWFVHRNGVVEPTNWKLQAILAAAVSHNKEVKEKLYGKSHGKM